MNHTRRTLLMQRWNCVQLALLPELRQEWGGLTPKLEKVIYTLEWVRLEAFVPEWRAGIGRPPHERAWLANAFVAKTVLRLSTTVALIERLTIDRALRRLCGFSMPHKLPSESTFSRAFDEFAREKLAERGHEALIQSQLGQALIGHISRDGTAIHAREKPAANPTKRASKTARPAFKRGRPRKGEVREAAAPSAIARQRQQNLAQMLAELPRACDRDSKCNAQGYLQSWKGYKLHLDTADCGVPISAVLSSASLHDSLAAVPLSWLTDSRVTHCYDLMDAAYCSQELRQHSRSLGHVPLIDHNARRGEKIPFAPHEAQRYKHRTQAERTHARLKDEFGADWITVRGPEKVMAHLMFGVLVLAADQLRRLLI